MNDNISTLTNNLLKLRENFDLRLAVKRQLDTSRNELSLPPISVADNQAQEHLEKVIEFRRWFRFFK